jgi:hypothetical protein
LVGDKVCLLNPGHECGLGTEPFGGGTRFSAFVSECDGCQMVCIPYKRLVTQWMIVIDSPHTDQSAVTAYWEAIEHRAACETCRDECFVNGCFGIYYMMGSRREKSRRL